MSLPGIIAPWRYQRLAQADGELATARAAAGAGTLIVVSTTAERSPDEIAAATDAPKWWQLYAFEHRDYTDESLRRSRTPAAARWCSPSTFRLWEPGFDLRNDFEIPAALQSRGGDYDPAISWDDVGWINGRTELPVIVKGILTPQDAHLAVDAGADGIVVSNRGGRQLDGAQAEITALPQIVEIVSGRIPVLMDGGVRRGVDVVKALALGAAAVVVTGGGAGADLHRPGLPVHHRPAFAADAVDTAGAGDAFSAALTWRLTPGGDLEEVVRWAAAAGALATRVVGARASLPMRAALSVSFLATGLLCPDGEES